MIDWQPGAGTFIFLPGALCLTTGGGKRTTVMSHHCDVAGAWYFKVSKLSVLISKPMP